MDVCGQLPTSAASPGWVGLAGSLSAMEKRKLLPFQELMNSFLIVQP
jgi:hypothetical protein